MMWYLWAILSMIADSSEKILDKIILIKDPERIDFLGAMFYRNLIFFVCIILIGLTGILGKLHIVFTLSFFILAVIYPLASYSYDYFLRNAEVSRFSAIFQTCPIFFVFLDNLVFHTLYSVVQVVGVFLLVAGSILYSYDVIERKKAFSTKGVLLIITYMAVNIYLYTIFKLSSMTVNGVSFYGSIWAVMMIVYAIFLIATKKYKKLKETAMSNSFLAKTCISKSLDALSSIFYTSALAIVSLTIVSAFTSIEPLATLIILMCLSLLTKVKVSEDFSRKTLALKVVASLIIVTGSLCIFTIH